MIEKGSCWSKWSTGISQVTFPLVQGGRGWGLRWRSGDSTRLPPMWPGFKSRRRRHMWVEFVVGSFLCSEKIFAWYSVFPLSSKAHIFKFHFRRGILAEEPLCACATSKPLFTYVFISLFQFLFVSVFVVSLAAVFWMSRNAPATLVAWHPKKGCEGDYSFCASFKKYKMQTYM